jgi:hypothetical protein
MGFFAVSSRGSTTPFSIEACHLTFWVLPRHWYQWVGLGFCYFFDVGLRIAPEKEMRRIRVAFPFDSKKTSTADLSNFVLDSDFAPLIFGRPITIVGNTLTYDGSTLGQGNVSDRVISVSTANSVAVEENDPRFSVWNLEFNDPIPAGEVGYVRFRLQIKKPGALWNSKGWGYAKRGMIVDLRIADVRESNILGLGKAEAIHTVPIKHLFLFLGAPSYFVPKHVSPPLHYSRLLEPNVWKQYLNASSRFPTSISIHQWRSDGAGTEAAKPVDLDHPYRAYMDISREFGRSLWFYYIAVTASLPLAFKAWNWAWTHIFESWVWNHVQNFSN